MADGAEGGGCPTALGLATTALAEETEKSEEKEDNGDDDGRDDNVAYRITVAVNGEKEGQRLLERERSR